MPTKAQRAIAALDRYPRARMVASESRLIGTPPPPNRAWLASDYNPEYGTDEFEAWMVWRRATGGLLPGEGWEGQVNFWLNNFLEKRRENMTPDDRAEMDDLIKQFNEAFDKAESYADYEKKLKEIDRKLKRLTRRTDYAARADQL